MKNTSLSCTQVIPALNLRGVRRFLSLFFISAFLFGCSDLLYAAGKIIYVKEDGTGTGETWATAMGSIGEAIAAAGRDAADSVYIKGGDYILPNTLTMSKNIYVAGSFEGLNESETPESRPMQAGTASPWSFQYQTTIKQSTPLFRTVSFDYDCENSVLDGVRITDGKSGDDDAAGIRLLNGTVRNCIVDNSVSTGTGSGTSVVSAGIGGFNPIRFIIENTLIQNNSITNSTSNFSGAGCAVWAGTNTLEVRISGCTADSNFNAGTMNGLGQYSGGGFFINMNGATDSLALFKIDNCIFSRNQTKGSGGGIAAGSLFSGTPPQAFEIHNSQFINNSCARSDVDAGGGAIANHDAVTHLNIYNCLFSGNVSQKAGGAIVTRSITSIDSAYFKNNRSEFNGGAFTLWNASSTVSNSYFENNSAQGNGGAIYLNWGTATLTNTVFIKNSNSGNGGAVYVGGDPAANGQKIDSAYFFNNSTTQNGGAVYVENGRSNQVLSMSNCDFRSNHAAEYGAVGGSNLSITLVNGLIANNYASGAVGGIQNTASTNCTLVNNSGRPAVNGTHRNSIFWGNENTPDNISAYNCAVTILPASGDQNFIIDETNMNQPTSPRFTSPSVNAGNISDTESLAANWKVIDGSILVNRADSNYLEGVTTALGGNARIYIPAGATFGYPDLGAYESPYKGVSGVSTDLFSAVYNGLPNDGLGTLPPFPIYTISGDNFIGTRYDGSSYDAPVPPSDAGTYGRATTAVKLVPDPLNWSNTSVTTQFEITPKAVSPSDIAINNGIYTHVYNGNPQSVTAAVSASVQPAPIPGDITIAYTGNRIDVGNYNAIVTLKNNFSGTTSQQMTITPAPVIFTVSPRYYQYTGNAIVPTMQSLPPQTAGDSYTVATAAPAINEGTYDASVTLEDPNWTFEGKDPSIREMVVGTFTIVPQSTEDWSQYITFNNTQQIYAEKPLYPTITVDTTGAAGKNIVIDSTYVGLKYGAVMQPVNADIYTVNVTLSGDVIGSAVSTFTLMPYGLDGKVNITDTEFFYDGTPKHPAFTFDTPGGMTVTPADYTVEYADYPSGTPIAGEPVNGGFYTVTITLQGNYTGSATSMMEIIKSDDRYITVSGSGNRSGRDWDNAMDSTQLKTAIGGTGSGLYFYFGAGTYYTENTSFTPRNGITMSGGYPAAGGTDTDPVRTPTIITRATNLTAPMFNNVTTLTVKDMQFDGNNVVVGGFPVAETFNISGTLTLINIIAYNNLNGVVRAENTGRIDIKNSLFYHNEGNFGGVLIYNRGATRGTIENSVFIGNRGRQTSDAVAGVIHCRGTVTMINCLLANNSTNAPNGGAINMAADNNGQAGNIKMTNCTLAYNKGYAIARGDRDLTNITTAYNTIFFGNDNITNINAGKFESYNTSTTVDPEFNAPYEGYVDGTFSNITEILTAYTQNGWTLQNTSPNINAGNNSYTSQITSDLAGNPRIFNEVRDGIADLGVYELQDSAPAILQLTGPSTWVYNTQPVTGFEIKPDTAPGASWTTTFTGIRQGEVSEAVNADTYTVSVLDQNSNWYSSETLALSVTPAPLTLSVTDTSMPFGGPLPVTYDLTITGVISPDTVPTVNATFTTTAAADSPIGNYPINIATATVESPNYTPETLVPGTLNITQKTLNTNQITINPPSNLIYSATPKTVTASISGGTPFTDSDYTIEYNGNTTNAGSFTATVLLEGNYRYADGESPKSESFTISPKSVTFQIPQYTVQYTGNIISYPADNVTVEGVISPDSVLPTVTGSGTEPGDYPVTATVTPGNYTGSQTNPAGLQIGAYEVTVVISDTTWQYGNPNTQALVTLSPAIDSYKVTYSGLNYPDTAVVPHNADTYTVTVEITDPRYTPTFTVSPFIITPAPITIAADNESKVYGTPDPTLNWRITVGELYYSDTISGSLSRAPGENYGEYPITQGTLEIIPDSANYTMTFIPGIFSITKVPVTFTVLNPTPVYTGSPIPADVSTNPILTETDSYTISYDPAIPLQPGVYNVKATLTDDIYKFVNHPDDVRTAEIGIMTVQKQTGSDSIIITENTFVYNGTAQQPTVTYLPGLDSSIADSVFLFNNQGDTIQAAVNADTYMIFVYTEGVFTVESKKASFTITALPVPASGIIISNTEQPYDGTPKSVTVSISDTTPFTDSDYSVTYNGSANPPAAAGRYIVKVTLQGNYKGSQNGILNITGVVPPEPTGRIAFAATSATVTAPGRYALTLTRNQTYNDALTVSLKNSGPIVPLTVSVPPSATFAPADTQITVPVTLIGQGAYVQSIVWNIQINPPSDTRYEVNPNAGLFLLNIVPADIPVPVADVEFMENLIPQYRVSDGATVTVLSKTNGTASIKVKVQNVPSNAITVIASNGTPLPLQDNGQFILPLKTGANTFIVYPDPSLLGQGALANASATLVSAHSDAQAKLTLKNKKVKFIFVNETPVATADLYTVFYNLTSDSFMMLNVTANDIPYGIAPLSDIKLAALSTDSGPALSITTQNGATAYIYNNQVIYNWTNIQNAEKLANGFTDQFSYIIDQTSAGSATGLVTVTVGRAATKGSDRSIPVAAVDKKPKVIGYYTDPYAKNINKPLKKISMKVGSGENNYFATLKSDVKLYNAKTLREAYKDGSFFSEVENTVQKPSLGLDIQYKAHGEKTYVQTAAMIIVPPIVSTPAGDTTLIPDSDYIIDYNDNVILIIHGWFFGDKPKAYFEYKQPNKTAVKKLSLPIVKSYKNSDGVKVEVPYGEMSTDGASTLYLKLPNPPKSSEGIYNLIIESGCGYGYFNNYPLE